jgi:DNA primase
MGTAMTDKQLAILKGLTRNLILALDADAAGQEAISRSGELIDKMLPVLKSVWGPGLPPVYGWVKYADAQNYDVKILVLPQGKDPDELIIEDASQWEKLIEKAKPMVDFILENAIAKVNLASIQDKSLAVERLLPLFSQMENPLRQAYYVDKLARLLKIDEDDIRGVWKRFKTAERKRNAIKNLQTNTPTVLTLTSSGPLEQYSLALLLQYPELKSEIVELSPDHFENTENRELFAMWQQSNDLTSLRDSLDSALQEHLDNLMATSFRSIITENESVRRETINECVIRLQERRLRTLESHNQELLAIEAEIGGVAAQLAKLEEQGLEISKQLQEIFVKQNHRHRPAKSDGK